MRVTILLITILLGSTMLHAQTSTLKGKILSQKAEELAGVTVTLQPANLTTSTDKEGNFQFLKIAAGSYTVGATSVGFSAKSRQLEVVAGKDFYIALSLDESQSALAEVTVVGNRQRGYNAPSSNVSTRVNLSLLETPQSIQVIPYQIIRDQQALSVNDVVKNIAGVQSISPGYSYYTFRGFESFNNGPGVITNGIRGINYGFFQTASLFNVDKVEAIKGPASALYSVGNPGGIINITTKKPLSTKQYELNLVADRFGDYRVIADATGPLGNSKKVDYRLIAGYNGGGNFRDEINTDYLFLAPSFNVRFSDKTSILIEYNQIFDKTNRSDRGILAPPIAGGGFDFNSIPLSWNRSGGPHEKGNIKSSLVQAVFTHHFSNSLSFTAMNSYGNTASNNSSFGYFPAGGRFNATGDSLVRRSWGTGPYGNKSINLNYFLNYKVRLNGLMNDLMVGFDYGSRKSYDRTAIYRAPSTSLRNPIITADPSTYPILERNDQNNTNSLLGINIQDIISFSDKLKMLVGIRYDASNGKENTSYNTLTTPNYLFDTKFDAFLPRIGVVYLPVKNVSLYTSYTTSYSPNFTDPTFGLVAIRDYKAESGRQFEAGVKSELMKGKLISTLAFYNIKKENVLQPDPTDPDSRRQVTVGEVVSKGMEFNVQGNISKGLSLLGFYAYNDIRITDDIDKANIGNTLGNAPKHSANLWAKYNLLEGRLKGLGFGGGVDYASEKVGQFSSDFIIPSYTNFDALISYSLRKYSLAINVYNLADTRQLRGGFEPRVIFPGMPRSFRVSLNVKL